MDFLSFFDIDEGIFFVKFPLTNKVQFCRSLFLLKTRLVFTMEFKLPRLMVKLDGCVYL